jgi:hypothetical protein
MTSYGGYGNGTPAGNSYGYGGGAAAAAPSYDYSASYGAGGSTTAATTTTSGSTAADGGGLRRRTATPASTYGSAYNDDSSNGKYNKGPSPAVVERLDILFPKVDREFIVHTKSGGIMTMVAYVLISILCLAEIVTWFGQNQTELSQTIVDTSLGKMMRVNLNITFPALACEDLHLDIIDVAGDSQLNIEDTLKKRKLHLDGRIFSKTEIDVETNQHRQMQEQKEQVLMSELPENYCGPCYGAQEKDDQCCQTCDEVLLVYSKKRWKSDLLRYTAEQCIREGRDKQEPKKMTKGQGCNLSGYMSLNRVSGNFHIAMGEGIERDGRHIHTYLPEDAPNFNASHVIHQLSFGPENGSEPLNGITKIVTEDTGTTGLFQYFLKIVPTTYIGDDVPSMPKGADSSPSMSKDVARSSDTVVETNRYFFTERFMPLMTDLLEDHHKDSEDPSRAAVHAGHSGGHDSHHHHSKQNAVLPGIFFIYEIYPFAVEIRRNNVPFTHLLIRLMATIGGVVTLVKWLDSCLYERGNRKKHDSRR